MARFKQLKSLVSGLILMAAFSSQAFTFNELHPFLRPLQSIGVAGVGTNGTIYCLSSSGGPFGDGALFHLTSTGSLTFAPFLTNSPFYVSPEPWVLGPDGSFWGIDEFEGLLRVDAQGVMTAFPLCGKNITMLAFNRQGNLFGFEAVDCSDEDTFTFDQKAAIYAISPEGQITPVATSDSCIENLWLTQNFIAASDGNFYFNISPLTSPRRPDTIIKITPAGAAFPVATFENQWCFDLAEGPDGIYGIAYSPLSNSAGRIFRLGFDGSFSNLGPFPALLGHAYWRTAASDKDGFFGATHDGGLTGHGVIFKVDFSGRVRVVQQLLKPTAITSLAIDAKGVLYGSREFLKPVPLTLAFEDIVSSEDVFVLPPGAFTPKVLHTFDHPPNLAPSLPLPEQNSPPIIYGGLNPPNSSQFSRMVEGRDHAFYFTGNTGHSICKMTAKGVTTIVSTVTNNEMTLASVWPATNGALFGVANFLQLPPPSPNSSGFPIPQPFPSPPSTTWLYNRTAAGRLPLLAPLDLVSNESAVGALLQGPNGHGYATVGSWSEFNSLHLVEITPQRVTVLGDAPGQLVAMDTNGGFYFLAQTNNYDSDCYSPFFHGTTPGNFTNFACRTIPPRTFSFLYDIDHAAPMAVGLDGSLYGFAFTNNLYRSIKVSLTSGLTYLADFPLGPPAALVAGPNGNLYGITSTGGDYNLGTVFQLTPDGTVTTLVSFNLLNGANPAGLIVTSDKKLLGWTQNGGSQYGGNIFTITGLFDAVRH